MVFRTAFCSLNAFSFFKNNLAMALVLGMGNLAMLNFFLLV